MNRPKTMSEYDAESVTSVVGPSEVCCSSSYWPRRRRPASTSAYTWSVTTRRCASTNDSAFGRSRISECICLWIGSQLRENDFVPHATRDGADGHHEHVERPDARVF